MKLLPTRTGARDPAFVPVAKYSVEPPLGQAWAHGGMRYCHLSVFLSSEEKKHRPEGSSWFPASLGLPWRRCAALVRGFSLSLPLRSPHILHSFTVQRILRGFADCSVCNQGSPQKRKNRKKTESLWCWAANLHVFCVEKTRGKSIMSRGFTIIFQTNWETSCVFS